MSAESTPNAETAPDAPPARLPEAIPCAAAEGIQQSCLATWPRGQMMPGANRPHPLQVAAHLETCAGRRRGPEGSAQTEISALDEDLFLRISQLVGEQRMRTVGTATRGVADRAAPPPRAVVAGAACMADLCRACSCSIRPTSWNDAKRGLCACTRWLRGLNTCHAHTRTQGQLRTT